MKARVLFIDDEVRVVRLLAMTFRRDYDVFTATNGYEAIDIIRRYRPHVIVSDQRMPKMTGVQLLATARTIVPHSVRILLTGYSDLVAIIGAINEGEVYRFLNKPWNHTELATALAEAAEIARNAELLPQNFDEHEQFTLAGATKLLAIDHVAKDRHSVMEMFMGDYTVLGAPTFEHALRVMNEHDVGVVVAEASLDQTPEMLARMRDRFPSTTIVLLAHCADSPTIIRLINQAHVYRFAMKPMAPNAFRLAVAAAMREHHRRLTVEHMLDQKEMFSRQQIDADEGSEGDARNLADGIIASLGRFTKVW